jgi:hypothetical protein
MGQRRKHMLQAAVNEEVQPPADGQHIVRALGSRGGNIVEVCCSVLCVCVVWSVVCGVRCVDITIACGGPRA